MLQAWTTRFKLISIVKGRKRNLASSVVDSLTTHTHTHAHTPHLFWISVNKAHKIKGKKIFPFPLGTSQLVRVSGALHEFNLLPLHPHPTQAQLWILYSWGHPGHWRSLSISLPHTHFSSPYCLSKPSEAPGAHQRGKRMCKSQTATLSCT